MYSRFLHMSSPISQIVCIVLAHVARNFAICSHRSCTLIAPEYNMPQSWDRDPLVHKLLKSIPIRPCGTQVLLVRSPHKVVGAETGCSGCMSHWATPCRGPHQNQRTRPRLNQRTPTHPRHTVCREHGYVYRFHNSKHPLAI